MNYEAGIDMVIDKDFSGAVCISQNGRIEFEKAYDEMDPNVTIRQLLNHTSGVPDYCDESIIEDYGELWTDYPNYKIRSLSDLLPLFILKPISNTHNNVWKYDQEIIRILHE